MNARLLNSKNLILTINGDNDWAFSQAFKVSYHATNFSKVILNNVIHKEMLRDNLHFENHPYLSQLDTFALATITDGTTPLFTGLINSQGRYSLNPFKVKDRSIEIVDVRLWLSKMSPADIVFIDLTPTQAVQEFIRALNEPKIKAGILSFTDDRKINAYDTTSKSPYSVLKDIIGTQSRSFLYFSQDSQGNLLINYKSENDFKNQQAISLNKHNWKDYQILDLKLEENMDNYFNKIRIESDNILSTTPLQEHFILSNGLKSLWLSEPFGRVVPSDDDYKSFYYFLDDPDTKHNLEIVSKKDYTAGKNYHLYYEVDSPEIVLNPDWQRENIGVYLSYYSKKKTAITLENLDEIKRLHLLNNFKGDIYRYEKFNDISNFHDLAKQAENQLALNSVVRKELKLETTKAFLELGDSVVLDFKDLKFDGRYIVIGFDAQRDGDFLRISYTLRNGLNADTLINFYDSQDFKINPYIPDDDSIIYKYRDRTQIAGNVFLLWKLHELLKTMLRSVQSGYLASALPYSHRRVLDYAHYTSLTASVLDFTEMEQ